MDDSLFEELKNLEDKWQKYADTAGTFLQKAPKGSVRVTSCRGKHHQYYYTEQESGPALTYAGKDKLVLVRQLVQKEYYQTIMNFLDPALRKLQAFIRCYDPDKPAGLYDALPAARKKLITPLEPTDESYVKDWLANRPAGSIGYETNGDILSNKGEAVRSKSEKIIADKLYELDIPYVYESPTDLPGLGTVYPDFTVLNVRLRKTFCFEHFGRMSDPEYAARTFKKIHAYADAGLWLGDGLLFTFETESASLNTMYLERMIRRYLL